jgi:probable phosphoglycerate mutase
VTEVVLVRHGETELNRLEVFRGRAEAALNERGRQQALWVSRALGRVPISAVFTSPLSRALDTSTAIARTHGLVPIVDEAFNNIDLGDWQGVPKAVVKRDHPEEWKLWTTNPEGLRIPGGETLADVRARAYPRMLELVREHEGKRVCVVSHRSVLKVVSAAAIGLADDYYWKLYLDNAAYSLLGYGHDTGFSLIKWNESCHVEERVAEEF